jgi:hypothetical protein
MYPLPKLPSFEFVPRVCWRSFEVIAALALLGLGTPAVASGDGFANVSFTVSGGPNAWILDFTVVPTDPANMENKSYIALFEIGVEGGTAFTQPSGYTATLIGGDTAWQGDKNVVASLKQSSPGGITGFETLVTSADAPTEVSWTVTLASGSFLNDFYVNGAYRATVTDTGIAHFVGMTPAVPELGTVPLMLLGLGGVTGVLLRRRRPFVTRADCR